MGAVGLDREHGTVLGLRGEIRPLLGLNDTEFLSRDLNLAIKCADETLFICDGAYDLIQLSLQILKMGE